MALPLINLDDKTFEELVQEARKQIPIYAPAWTDHNLHDPGITLIELFAWLTEIMLYRQNKVTEKSKWKFLRLMGKEEPKNNGNEAQNLAKAILEVQRDMKTIHRAVTSEDYEHLLLNASELEVPKIARVKAIPCYHPKQHQEVPGIVTIVVEPNSSDTQQEPGDFLRKVYQYLYNRRMLTTELFVIYPGYVEVSVETKVIIKPQYLGKTVGDNVNAGLTGFLDPLHGGPEGNGWPFGRPVYRSEIMKVIDGAEGVDYVEEDTLRMKVIDAAEGVDYVKNVTLNGGNNDIFIPRHSLVKSGEHTITYEEKT